MQRVVELVARGQAFRFGYLRRDWRGLWLFRSRLGAGVTQQLNLYCNRKAHAPGKLDAIVGRAESTFTCQRSIFSLPEQVRFEAGGATVNFDRQVEIRLGAEGIVVDLVRNSTPELVGRRTANDCVIDLIVEAEGEPLAGCAVRLRRVTKRAAHQCQETDSAHPFSATVQHSPERKRTIS